MRRTIGAAMLLAMLTALPALVAAQEPDSKAAEEVLYVVSAVSGSAGDGSLTLDGVDRVLYFSDRPVRDAGHLTVEAFLDGWDRGDDSFAADPPNAVLSLLDGNEAPADTVVELTSAELDGEALLFGIAVLAGPTPDGAFGRASLFVDTEARCGRSGDNIGALTLDGDYSGCDFTGASFDGVEIQAYLKDAIFTDASFSGASFDIADLTDSTGPGNDTLQDATFFDTRCADGTSSDDHGDTCIGHGEGW